MSPLLFNFLDGTSFFAGLAITLVAELLILRFRSGLFRMAMTIAVVAGMLLVVASATPLPAWVYGIWFAAAGAALTAARVTAGRWKPRRVAAVFLIVVTGSVGFAELRHSFLPRITLPRGTKIYVIGDSISAGIGGEHQCWPALFSEMTSLPAVNLARAGATVESAIKQAGGVTETNAIVILEIGGNDIISGTDAATFQRQLETLVSMLRLRGNRVLMLELPLFPFQNAYGAAQRAVAAKYDCVLVPKRCFAAVLGTRNGTVDGLHLSPEGHEAMAKMFARVIRLRPGSNQESVR